MTVDESSTPKIDDDYVSDPTEDINEIQTEPNMYTTTTEISIEASELISELAAQNKMKEKKIHNLLMKLESLELKNKNQEDQIKKLKGKNQK